MQSNLTDALRECGKSSYTKTDGLLVSVRKNGTIPIWPDGSTKSNSVGATRAGIKDKLVAHGDRLGAVSINELPLKLAAVPDRPDKAPMKSRRATKP
jgi:hypothetical protein